MTLAAWQIKQEVQYMSTYLYIQGQQYFRRSVSNVLLLARCPAKESAWSFFKSFIQKALILDMYKLFFLYL